MLELLLLVVIGVHSFTMLLVPEEIALINILILVIQNSISMHELILQISHIFGAILPHNSTPAQLILVENSLVGPLIISVVIDTITLELTVEELTLI